MGTNFYNADTNPDNNTTIGGVGAQGVNKVSNFDNALREMHSQTKKFVLDLGGANTVGGTADAIAITTNQVITAYLDGLLIPFIAGGDNTLTTATVNVDGLGAKAIKKVVDGVETAIAEGDIQGDGLYFLRYRSAWESTAGAFQLVDLNHDTDVTFPTEVPILDNGVVGNDNLPTPIRRYAAIVSDWNSAVENGWFMASDAANNPNSVSGLTGWCIGQVIAHNAVWVSQEVHYFTGDTVGNSSTYRRDCNNGTWTAWRRVYKYADEIENLASSDWTYGSADTASNVWSVTGLPAGISEFEIMLENLITTQAGDALALRIGDAGGLETTGYSTGGAALQHTGILTTGTTSAGFILWGGQGDQDNENASGIVRLVRMAPGTNKWVCQSLVGFDDNPVGIGAGGGTKVLSGELTQMQMLCMTSEDIIAGQTVYYRYR
jgi:hypothetical protein